MSIEDSLERIATALETLVGVQAGDAGAAMEKKPAAKGKGKGKKKETPPPPPDDDLDGDDEDLPVEKEFTEDDLMDQLREVIRVKGKDDGKAALKKFKAGRVSEIKPADAAAFHAHCQGLLDG